MSRPPKTPPPMPISLSLKELEIISHALELCINRYEAQRDHWKWYRGKSEAMNLVTRDAQMRYQALEDVMAIMAEDATVLIEKIDDMLKPRTMSPPAGKRRKPKDTEDRTTEFSTALRGEPTIYDLAAQARASREGAEHAAVVRKTSAGKKKKDS